MSQLSLHRSFVFVHGGQDFLSAALFDSGDQLKTNVPVKLVLIIEYLLERVVNS